MSTLQSGLRGASTNTSALPLLPDYPDRIITFIDLLDFSRDVQMIEQRPTLLLSIDAVFGAIVRCKHDLDIRRARQELSYDVRLTQISDAVVLSYRLEVARSAGRFPTRRSLEMSACGEAICPEASLQSGSWFTTPIDYTAVA